jgi:plasmid stabilization system protein ParE
MESKIELKKRYINKLNLLLEYLNKEWNYKVASGFQKEIDRRILQLSLQPNIGVQSTKYANARSILISKHNRLVYKIKPATIVIIDLIDTRKK